MTPFERVRIRSERAVVGNSDTKANNPFGSCLHPDMLIRIKEGLFFAGLSPCGPSIDYIKWQGLRFVTCWSRVESQDD